MCLVSSWLKHRWTLLAAVMAGLLMQAVAASASAQGRLDARYRASLAGLLIGRGAWVIEVGDHSYLAAASGKTSGILRLFSQGEGTGAARGSVVHGRLVPASYAASITSGKKTSEVRMALHAGTVKTLTVTPKSGHDPARVPLTKAHKHGVIDPMTASLFRAETPGDPLVAKNCNRTVPVFDGHMRYNLQLRYKRMDHIKAKGYDGPVLVCGVEFKPIAGHDPHRIAIRYLMHLHSMELWLAPIAGTSILVPIRFDVPTPFGLGVVEATQFESVPQAPRPTPTSGRGP